MFASSVPGVIEPGAEWLKDIRDNLSAATAVIVIVTPTSINRPWVWFEVGASWSRMEEGEGKIIPICVPEIDKGSLPEPLGRLHAMSLGKAGETKEVFLALIDQFGFGSIKGFRHGSIKAKLPKYDDLPVADVDLKSGTIYGGPYESYSNEELVEVIDEEIVAHAWGYFEEWSTGKNLFNGALIHFRKLDERYELPPGAARELLVSVVTDRYPAVVVQKTANTVRFEGLRGERREAWIEATEG